MEKSESGLTEVNMAVSREHSLPPGALARPLRSLYQSCIIAIHEDLVCSCFDQGGLFQRRLAQ